MQTLETRHLVRALAKADFVDMLDEFDVLIEQGKWSQAVEDVRSFLNAAINADRLMTDRVVEVIKAVLSVINRIERNVPYCPPELVKKDMWTLRQQLFLFAHEWTIPTKLS